MLSSERTKVIRRSSYLGYDGKVSPSGTRSRRSRIGILLSMSLAIHLDPGTGIGTIETRQRGTPGKRVAWIEERFGLPTLLEGSG